MSNVDTAMKLQHDTSNGLLCAPNAIGALDGRVEIFVRHRHRNLSIHSIRGSVKLAFPMNALISTIMALYTFVSRYYLECRVSKQMSFSFIHSKGQFFR